MQIFAKNLNQNRLKISTVTSLSIFLILILLNPIYKISGPGIADRLEQKTNTREIGITDDFGLKINSTLIELLNWRNFRGDLENTGKSQLSEIPQSNQTLWIFNAKNPIKSSPAVANKRVYFATTNGTVICLSSEDGTELWRNKLEPIEYSSPSIGENRLIIGTSNGGVFCLNSSTGKIIWNISTGNLIESSPKIYNEMVYICSYDSNLYILNLTTGDRIWNFSTGERVHISPAISNDRIYIGGCGGILYGLFIENKTNVCEYNTGNFIVSSPAVMGDKVFFGTYDTGIFCVDATTGKLFWNNPIQGAIKSSPSVSDEMVIFADTMGKIYSYDISNGELVWTYNTGSEIYSSPAIAQDKVVVGSKDKLIYCLNLTTGDPIWNFTTEGSVESSPALAYNRIFIGSDDGNLYCFGKLPNASITKPRHLGEITKSELEIIGYAGVETGMIAGVEVKVNSGQWVKANGTVNWNINLNMSCLENGVHTIYYHAFDGVAFSEVLSLDIILNLTINETPGSSIPKISIISPSHLQETNTTNVILDGNASVKGGEIKFVEVKLDSGPWLRTNGTNNWSITLNMSNQLDGLHVISSRAFDGKNYSQRKWISIIYSPIGDNGGKPDNGNETNGNITNNGKDKVKESEPAIEFSTLLLIISIIVSFIIIMAVILNYGKTKYS